MVEDNLPLVLMLDVWDRTRLEGRDTLLLAVDGVDDFDLDMIVLFQKCDLEMV